MTDKEVVSTLLDGKICRDDNDTLFYMKESSKTRPMVDVVMIPTRLFGLLFIGEHASFRKSNAPQWIMGMFEKQCLKCVNYKQPGQRAGFVPNYGKNLNVKSPLCGATFSKKSRGGAGNS